MEGVCKESRDLGCGCESREGGSNSGRIFE